MKKLIALTLTLAIALSCSGCIFFEDKEDRQKDIQYQIYFEGGTVLISEENPYGIYVQQYEEYLLPESCSQYLCWGELSELSTQALYLAQQEIYARYGQRFDDQDLQEYFNARPWYTPVSDDVTESLSSQASANAYLLEVYMAMRDDSIRNWDNRYLSAVKGDYVLPDSDSKELTAEDLKGLSEEELVVARNEIYARHGYVFKDKELGAYFYTKSWYRPTTSGAEFDHGRLSQLETKNVQLIQKAENGQLVTVPDQITVVDGYIYLLGDHCYHIPHVDMSVAGDVNAKMYEVHYKQLESYVFSEPNQPFLVGMAYSVSRYADVVCVVVHVQQDWGADDFVAYNFSASTGRILSDSEVFAAFGLSADGGRARAYEVVSAYCDSLLNSALAEQHYEILKGCVDRTLADENIAKFKPYIDGNGQLGFYGDVYSVAGAERYEELINSSGKSCGIYCQIH